MKRELTYTNPVYPEYFADPFVWRTDGGYYAIGTGHDEARGVVTAAHAPTIFPLLYSVDLIAWTPVGRALIRPDPKCGTTFWAPEVVRAQGQWWLYYSAGFEDRQHHLRVASSDRPSGPYVDCGALTRVDECPFAIDPHAFQDDDGRWYLFHSRDFLNAVDERGRTARAGTALVVYPLESMTQLAVDGVTVARAHYDWQRFRKDRPMYGATYDWHTLEGPCLVKHQDRYYCLYSGGCWQTDTYGVDYVVGESVLGPYSDEGAAHGARLLRTVPDRLIGPGHCSVVTAPDDEHLYIVYHAWDRAMTARRMCIDPLRISELGIECSGPSWVEQSLLLSESNGQANVYST